MMLTKLLKGRQTRRRSRFFVYIIPGTNDVSLPKLLLPVLSRPELYTSSALITDTYIA